MTGYTPRHARNPEPPTIRERMARLFRSPEDQHAQEDAVARALQGNIDRAVWRPLPMPERDDLGDQARRELASMAQARRDAWSGTRDTDRPEAWGER